MPPDVVLTLLRQAGTTIEAELRGRSMAGTLEHGARVRIACGDGQVPRLGDVVAFRAADGVTVHRIVGRGPGGDAARFLLTRGDGAVLTDHPVARAQVVGVVREWRDGAQWRPIPAAGRGGWRRMVAQAAFWPVQSALFVHHRLAFAVTVACYSVRALWQGAIGRR